MAAAVCGAALAWGLWRYGATETWELYRLFLWVLVPAMLIAWTLPLPSWRGVRASALLLVGCYLLAQTALKPTLEGRGYALAALGWLGLFLGLGLASRGRRAARGVLLFLVLAGGLEALYGLIQVLSESEVIGARYRIHGATGTLFNRNHFAGLLNMTLPLAIGALFTSFGRRGAGRSPRTETYAWTWVVLLSCSFMGLATLLSLSRAGTLTLVSTLVFMTFMLTVDRRLPFKRGLPARAAWLLLLTVLGLGLAVGLDALMQRFADLSESREGRAAVYADSLRLIRDHPVSGVGPGMYRWRFRPYQTTHPEIRYDHAHNDYLETAADWGAPAAIALWGFVCWRLYRACRRFFESRSPWRQGLALGCSGSIFSILVHSFVDFNLQIPTHLMIFGAVLGLAWSLELPRRVAGSSDKSGPQGAVSRFLIGILLPLLIAGAGWRVFHQFTAAQVVRARPTPEGLEEALRWDPSGPGYHYRLAIVHRDVPERRDPDKARRHLEKAVELNPFNWRYRRELAQLYELSGHLREAEEAFLQALALSPRSASYRWRLANFYLRSGSLEQAVPQLRAALAGDRGLLQPTPGLLLKAGGSYEQIDRVWPQDREARRMLLHLLSRREPSAGEAPMTGYLRKLWDRLLDDAEPLSFADGHDYIERLLGEQRFAEAREQWIELARRNGVVDVGFETERNYVWNGDFESPLSQAVLGWRLHAAVGYSASRAEGEGFEDSTALRLDFDGSQNLSFAEARQLVVVRPGRTYTLSFRARSRDLSTDQGVFFEVVDGPSRRLLLATDALLGSTPWTPYSGSFRVAEESHWVFVRLRRNPSLRFDNLFRGSLWIDSVRVTAS